MASTPDISYRRFDLGKEDPGKLFGLFDLIYGSSSSIKSRWEWEFLRHPHRDRIMVFIAESAGEPVGMTVRMPVEIVVADQVMPGYFATNSMVVPQYRGKGIIGRLYAMASGDGALQLSKGTADGMYAVLKKTGYQDILPNSYQVCILDPIAWLWQRLMKTQGKSGFPGNPLGGLNPEFRPITALDEQLDAAINSFVRPGVRKTRGYLQWRYFDIPHKKYQVFLRVKDGTPAALLVLKLDGSTAYLADILWRDIVPDEPSATIQFARQAARKLGAHKLVAWGVLGAYRTALRRNFFFDRGESPHFSYFCKDAADSCFDWSNMHFVHGDGDIDYL